MFETAAGQFSIFGATEENDERASARFLAGQEKCFVPQGARRPELFVVCVATGTNLVE
jgi:hypothetical protein